MCVHTKTTYWIVAGILFVETSKSHYERSHQGTRLLSMPKSQIRSVIMQVKEGKISYANLNKSKLFFLDQFE